MPTYDVFERQAQLKVYADGRYLAALQQGLYRPYVFPVRTMQGHVVTQAGPADHPHHLSIWLGHASVNGLNFWAPETLGIYPPPKILVRDTRTDISDQGVTFDQRIEWLDGAGGLVLRERRRTGVRLWAGHMAVDVVASLSASDAAVNFGQDKDAGLALRIADQIDVLDGGEIRSATGARNEAATFDTQANWVDYSGPVTNDHVAGVAIFPYPERRGHTLVHARLRPDLRGPVAAQCHDAGSRRSFTARSSWRTTAAPTTWTSTDCSSAPRRVHEQSLAIAAHEAVRQAGRMSPTWGVR